MPQSKPWMELVQTGTFSDDSLNRLPESYQIGDEWVQLLEASESAHVKKGLRKGTATTWLHDLHLGIAYTERGAVLEPKKRFARSLATRPNPIAARFGIFIACMVVRLIGYFYRCLAVLEDTVEAALPFYMKVLLPLTLS